MLINYYKIYYIIKDLRRALYGSLLKSKEKKMVKTKEMRWELRIRNNLLLKAILEMFPSIRKFCEVSGIVSYNYVVAIINLRVKPLNKDGDYKKNFMEIAYYLGISCRDLFPLELYNLKRKRTVMEISFSDLHLLPFYDIKQIAAEYDEDPLELAMKNEISERVNHELSVMGGRREKVIRMRLGIRQRREYGYEYSLEDIGYFLNITRERARQDEAKAIKWLVKNKVLREL
jgi:hypothetical protein